MSARKQSRGWSGRASRRVGLALLSLAATGCAPEFAKVSEIETLRVLGVKKDKPYAAPGEEVTLSMLWNDGSPWRAASGALTAA